MGDALPVQVGYPGEDLLEAALDLARAHAAFLNRRVQVAAGTELHHLTPVLRLVLDEVDGLDDVDVVQGGRDAELGGELLDVFLLRLVLAPLAEFLQSRSVLPRSRSHTGAPTLTAYSFSSLRSHLCARRTTEVAPLPIATFSHTPYFLSRLAVLSPPTDLPSESDLRLLPPVERWDERRESLGPFASRSLSVNFWPPSSDLTDDARRGAGAAPAISGDVGAEAFLDDRPEKTFMIAGRSLLVLFARLADLAGGARLHSLSEIVGVGECEEAEPAVDFAASDLPEGVRTSMARSPRVVPGCFAKARVSGGGRGMVLWEVDRSVGARDGLAAGDLPFSRAPFLLPAVGGESVEEGLLARLGGLLSEPSVPSPSAWAASAESATTDIMFASGVVGVGVAWDGGWNGKKVGVLCGGQEAE